jgi:alkylation response protein AidB-like acyl-CoA dehydrogenase
MKATRTKTVATPETTVPSPSREKSEVASADSGPAQQPRPVAGGVFLLEPVIRPIFSREQFSSEQREIEKMVRQLAEERIAPRAEELDKPNEKLSRELLQECAELGLTAVDIPERFDGMALDKTTSALVVEALTRCGSASWIVTFSAHVGIGTLPIVYFGTEDQKRRYLPKLGSMEFLGAYALTEPGSGSDATNLATTARLSDDGSGFVINGNKMWITNGGWADLFIVFANLEGAGVTAFLVERTADGLTTGPEEHKMGIKGSSTVVLNLDDVWIPKENLLGAPGGGVPIALNTLNIGRFKLGAADLGGCKTVIQQATTYALERLQFGQPIAYFEAIRKKFADMVVHTYRLDSAIYRTVGLMDDHIASLDRKAPEYAKRVMSALEEYAIEASISKVYGSETMARVADHGVQIYGGYGFSEEYPMARVYRDCRIDRIFEGTNEINRMVIYGYFLKKALMEELPLREAQRNWRSQPPTRVDALEWEINSLHTARGVIVELLFEAISIYGQDLRNAQIVGEDLADLIIGYFGATSAINRIHHLGEGALLDRTYRALARLVVASFLEDFHRLVFRLRPTLFGDAYGQKKTHDLDRMSQQLQVPFDPVREVQILTDDLYDRGYYRFE